MTRKSRAAFRPVATAGVVLAIASFFAVPPDLTADEAEGPAGIAASAEASPDAPRSVDEARRQARLLHGVYDVTLRAIHRRYFDADEKDAIPARALEDVFKESDAGTRRTTRWIAVNTPAMNVDHEPRPGFEERAAEALTSGRENFELVEGDVYHRAAAVPLVASCLRCHESGLTKQIAKPRVAALVITMPVRPE